MKKLTDYFTSRPALKISVLEREMNQQNSAYPVGTLKLALNPNQGRDFPSQWVWLLASVLKPYGGLIVENWTIKPDDVPNIFILIKKDEKEVWDLADLVKMILT